MALEQLVAAATDALAWDCTIPPVAASGDRLRLVAANLTSGRNQSYDEGHGTRILTALDADVVLLQEARYGDGSDDAFQAWVDSTFGPGAAFVRGSARLPNAVVSVHPILESGVWTDPHVSNRDFVWARIDVPGDADLWAVSVHLLTRDEPSRAAQAAELTSWVGEAVPAGDLLVIGGDFNTRSYEEDALEVLSQDVVIEGPYPADQAGNTRTNSARQRPYDLLLVDRGLHERRAVAELGSGRFPHGLVVDTRVHEPIEDLAPAQAGDSAAFQIQHMAVVRDFELGEGAAAP